MPKIGSLADQQIFPRGTALRETAWAQASPSRRRAMKRPRSWAELADMAQRLGEDWRPGDKVMTWIRRHEATSFELSRLVRDGWSWADVGLALALAGIRYKSGMAIAADVLQRKAAQARADERRRQAGPAARLRPGVAGPHTLPELDMHDLDAPDLDVQEPPCFPLVTLRSGGPAPRPCTPLNLPLSTLTASAMPVARASDEEILRRVFG